MVRYFHAEVTCILISAPHILTASTVTPVLSIVRMTLSLQCFWQSNWTNGIAGEQRRPGHESEERLCGGARGQRPLGRCGSARWGEQIDSYPLFSTPNYVHGNFGIPKTIGIPTFFQSWVVWVSTIVWCTCVWFVSLSLAFPRLQISQTANCQGGGQFIARCLQIASLLLSGHKAMPRCIEVWSSNSNAVDGFGSTISLSPEPMSCCGQS